jgi:hypothetical protein
MPLFPAEDTAFLLPAALVRRVFQGRRPRERVFASLALLAAYADLAHGWLIRWVAESTRTQRALVLTLLIVAAILVNILLFDGPAVAGGVAVAGLLPAVVLLLPVWLHRRRRLQQAIRGKHPVEGIPPAAMVLRQLGIDEDRVARILGGTVDGETRLGSFDYESRLLSVVGPIPFFKSSAVTASEFLTRDRHQLDLVVARGVVCVKKRYLDRASFENELLALHAVADLGGVPRLIAVHPRERVLYLSFLTGVSLATLLAARGATDAVQQQVSSLFARRDRWSPAVTARGRQAAVAALRASVDPAVMTKLAQLMDRIHARKVTIGDVKYGNVLLCGGEPSLCDFDFATVFRSNGWRCLKGRETDREKFNYFFGAGVLSEREYRRSITELLAVRPDLAVARIHFGYGYVNHPGGSLGAGSGRWLLLRRHLPECSGRGILDLGGDGGLLALAMIRAGARRATLVAPDPLVRQYAELNRRWAEFVDNRLYPDYIAADLPLGEAGRQTWPGHDLAICLNGLDAGEPATAARLIGQLSETVASFVVRVRPPQTEGTATSAAAGLDGLQELLAQHGYPRQKVVWSPFDDVPIVIGARADP